MTAAPASDAKATGNDNMAAALALALAATTTGAAAGRNRHPVRDFGVAAALGLTAATLHDRYRAELRAIAADPLGDDLVPIPPRRTRT